jgi:hypothetical protein
MRMVVILSETERQLLNAMSERDLRFPRDQMRYLLIQEAKRRGLLPAPSDNQPAEVQHAAS